jgi:hypothetical protein
MTAPYASELARLYAEIDHLAGVGDLREFVPRPENLRQEDRCWIIEGPSGGFVEHYMERGRTSVVVEGDYDTVLFEVMRSAAQDRATRIELRQRIAGQDTRRQWFAIQRDILASLKPEWAERFAEHQDAVLARHPFKDDHGPAGGRP